jgi:hypothetical protein
MTLPVERMVAEAFSDEESDHAEKFTDLTLSSWNKVSDAIGRTAVLILILAAVFEILVASKAPGDFAIGSFTFGNAPLVQQFLPALVSYLVYDMYVLTSQYGIQGRVYFTTMQRFHPKLYESGLPFRVLPPVRGPWSTGILSFSPKPPERLIERFDNGARMWLGIVVGMAFPIAFIAQAYYALFQKYGFTAGAIWVSMLASLLFTAGWILRVYFNTYGE